MNTFESINARIKEQQAFLQSQGNLEDNTAFSIGFNLTGEPINFEHWLKLEQWTNEEAAKLLCGINPNGNTPLSEVALEITQRSLGEFKKQTETPFAWLQWFNTIGLLGAAPKALIVWFEQKTALVGNTKERNKSKNDYRNEDFKQWLNEAKPDLEKRTKQEIHNQLIERNSQLWASGFDDWVKVTTLYKGKSGRPKGQ